jgi:hypothetical protein
VQRRPEGAVGPAWLAEAAAHLTTTRSTTAAAEIKLMFLVQSVSEYVLLNFSSIYSEFAKLEEHLLSFLPLSF